ncbi:hypothetical protein NC653_041958 [Populus alba x Populus x berolinensis]|uniref:Uncharacterized protein n=1 Tax=Populus alba x Populus x berolinensis TaxID=444605 RepID=A0AAD6L9T6_9ROSI|nr:hypothetical protein NC653_041958 [Populus alba x Populus x berolinensis]
MSIHMWDPSSPSTSKHLMLESVGILRVHHSIGDGDVLHVTFHVFVPAKHSDPEALPTLPISKKQKPCSF